MPSNTLTHTNIQHLHVRPTVDGHWEKRVLCQIAHYFSYSSFRYSIVLHFDSTQIIHFANPFSIAFACAPNWVRVIFKHRFNNISEQTNKSIKQTIHTNTLSATVSTVDESTVEIPGRRVRCCVGDVRTIKFSSKWNKYVLKIKKLWTQTLMLTQ